MALFSVFGEMHVQDVQMFNAMLWHSNAWFHHSCLDIYAYNLMKYTKIEMKLVLYQQHCTITHLLTYGYYVGTRVGRIGFP